jgi:translation initiation factor IF-3
LFKPTNINHPETVRLIGTDDKQIAVMSYTEAQKKAEADGYDLIEVSSKAVPPIYKLGDYGKFLYQKAKELKKQQAKQKGDESKTIKISFMEGVHDMEIKAKKAGEFLADNKKVDLLMILRAREKAHRDLAGQKFESFLKMIPGGYQSLSETKSTPGGFFITIKKS